MRRHPTMTFIFRFCLLCVFLFSAPQHGQASELTQRDWMIAVVDTLGWSYGLPDEPRDADYINILSGNRTLLFEAEDIFDPERDPVSLMSLNNFGDFSGSAWLHGRREPTTVHLRFTLPLDGEYQLQANLRQPGHRFKINGIEGTAEAQAEFALVDVGRFQLQAGDQEIVAILPPNGSIDHIVLKAPNLVSIKPDGGWQPEASLTWEDLHITLLQLFNLAELLPGDPTPQTLEAEVLATGEASVVDIQHLGRPSGGKWLRAGSRPVEIRFPFKINSSGFYDVILRVMGDPVEVSIDGHQEVSLKGKDYLDDYAFKPLFFFAGENSLSVRLPPEGGLDSLRLKSRRIDPAITEALLGLEQSDQPQTRDFNTFISLLAALGVDR